MTAMRLAHSLFIALTLASSGCGGAVGMPPAMDGGATARSSAGTDAGNANLNTDSGSCMVLTSNYDQSCAVDADCTLVWSGNFCVADCKCMDAPISVAALARFDTDVAATPFGAGEIGYTVCDCPTQLGPCCRQGTCQNAACSSPADTMPACADAGGSCIVGRCGGASGASQGPPYSCAYADQTCCLALPSH